MFWWWTSNKLDSIAFSQSIFESRSAIFLVCNTIPCLQCVCAKPNIMSVIIPYAACLKIHWNQQKVVGVLRDILSDF